MSDYPIVKCPKCSAEQIDMDGFGFIACDMCGHCTHSSAEQIDGVFICTLCGSATTEQGGK